MTKLISLLLLMTLLVFVAGGCGPTPSPTPVLEAPTPTIAPPTPTPVPPTPTDTPTPPRPTDTPTPPTPNCTPGYDPCIPNYGADWDCTRAGGGNGPYYVEDLYSDAIRVTGSDPYGLDRDRDGWGCE